MRLLPPFTIIHPPLRQKEPAADRPVKRRTGHWLISDILRADHHLAVRNLSQSSAVLGLHPHRLLALLGEPAIVQREDPMRRTAGCQLPDTGGIQGERIPVGIREKVLEAFGRGPGDRSGDEARGVGMPRSENKRQKSLARKAAKRKQKKHSLARQALPAGERARLRLAASWALHECLITRDWDAPGEIIQILVARSSPE